MIDKKVAKKTGNIFNIMAVKYNLEPQKFLETICKTVIKPGKDGRAATMEEVAAFLIVAHKYGLDPFTGEISAFPSKRGGIIPVVGIDGFVRKINNHKDFNGMELSFSEDTATMDGAKECPAWCEVKLYRKGIERPTIIREYLDEVYVPMRSNYSGPWQTHTKRMLRHKAIIQAGRAAGFLTGIYDPDEAERIMDAEAQITEPTKKPEVEIPQAIEDGTTTVVLSTEPQQKAIHTLGSKIYKKKEDFVNMLGRECGVEHTRELTKDQASKLIEKLSKEINGNGK